MCARSPVDRTLASGAESVGSTPAERTSFVHIYSSLADCCFLLLFHKIYYKIAEKGQVAFLFYIIMHIIYLQSIENKKD